MQPIFTFQLKLALGLDLLKQHLLKLAGYQINSEGVFMARARHLEALTASRGTFE